MCLELEPEPEISKNSGSGSPALFEVKHKYVSAKKGSLWIHYNYW